MTDCTSCGEPIAGPYVTTSIFHHRGQTVRHRECADREDGPSITGPYLPMTSEILADWGHPTLEENQ